MPCGYLHVVLYGALFLSLATAQAQCVFSSTECQCALKPAGNACLRYASGTGASLQCEVYSCSAGYVCDCSGSEMCDVSDCSSNRDMYRKSDSAQLVVGQTVSCQPADQATCVNLRPSVSPAPSSSPSASPSASASLSSSPLSEIPLGGACDGSIPCVTGAGCSCFNVCDKLIDIEVTAMGDDDAQPWVCGQTSLGPASANYFTSSSWTYTGTCSDLFFRVRNGGGGVTGLVLAVREVGGAWLPNSFAGGSGLTGVVKSNPSPDGFLTDPNYDFSSWTEPVGSTSLQKVSTYMDFRNTYGSEYWTQEDRRFESRNLVTWYKVDLPFC